MTFSVQEGLAEAQQITNNLQNPEVDIVHLWKALAEKTDSLLVSIYERAGIAKQDLEALIDEIIKKKPKVSGTSTGGQYLSSNLQKLFLDAEKEAKQLEDEYLSVEHLILGLTNQQHNEISSFLIKNK